MSIEEHKILFDQIEQTIKLYETDKSFGSEYPKEIDGKMMSLENIINFEENDLFFYMDGKLLDNIVQFLTKLDSVVADDNDYECCVCYDMKKKKDMLFIPCVHNVCNRCSQMICDQKCPMCRGHIWETYNNNKLCIVALGEPTTRYQFENNGYKSVKILMIPPIENTYVHVFRGITFNDSLVKSNFRNKIKELTNQWYSFIIQEKDRFNRWAEYIDIDIKFNED